MSDERVLHLHEIAVAMLAYAVETDEIFNVDEEIMKTIMKSMVENNTVPEIAIESDGEGRRKYGVRLVEQNGL